MSVLNRKVAVRLLLIGLGGVALSIFLHLPWFVPSLTEDGQLGRMGGLLTLISTLASMLNTVSLLLIAFSVVLFVYAWTIGRTAVPSGEGYDITTDHSAELTDPFKPIH